jgi:hypothetical protein
VGIALVVNGIEQDCELVPLARDGVARADAVQQPARDQRQQLSPVA